MSSSSRRINDSVSSARACCAAIARPVTVLSESAAVFLAARVPAVETARALPTQTIMIMIAIPPATSPMLTRRLVRWASQRWAYAPNSRAEATTTIAGAGIVADAVVSASSRAEVCS